MDKLIFKTKKDWLGVILLLGPSLLVSILTSLVWVDFISIDQILSKEHLLFVTGFFWVYFLITWNFTYYILDDEYLTARMAYFVKTRVKLSSISEMKKIEFGNFTTGLSKDVLSIHYGNGKLLNISPIDRDEVIGQIEKRKSSVRKG